MLSGYMNYKYLYISAPQGPIRKTDFPSSWYELNDNV